MTDIGHKTLSLHDRRRLLLASTSPFRRELLMRLQLPFEVLAPCADETPWPDEQPPVLAARLAESKARSIAQREPGTLVIGSDQVAVLEGDILGKPGDYERAVAQLSRASGKTLMFYTGLCLIDSDSGRRQVDVVPFRVVFRTLTPAQISNYLHREQPYQCAGSFKSEGLGIALFERLEGDDPSSLIGLPLIRLIRMLEAEGVSVV
jgi:septum formation protein